ncbi:MAG TPA: hypothetical protein VH302_02480 [Bryobacteraceae bacterium]|nr:hypothetical protein [Bryobacteraceae bacterium]
MIKGVPILAAVGTALITSALAFPQAQTISAKPGVVNYIEGTAYLNGNKLSAEAIRATFLASGDSVSTDTGKVEVLLSPGVFLRLGEHSEVRMISPTILNTQFAVLSGEAMVEAAGLIKDNTVVVTDHGATITIEKNGLYRFIADAEPSAAVIDGKALVYFGDKKVDLGKDHEAFLTGSLETKKFNPKQPDDLYAWSNIRSEYEAAATYQSAQALSGSSSYGFATDAGYGGYYGPGWMWNGAFSSYAWLPANGAFYSPFGWGFYSPGMVGYAPVVTTGIYRGGTWVNGKPGTWQPGHHHWNGGAITATVPVNTKNPPAVGVLAASPYALHEARVQAAQSLQQTGTFSPRVSTGNALLAGSTRIAGSTTTPVRGGGWVGGAHGDRAASTGGWSGGGVAARASGGFPGGGAHEGRAASTGGWSGGGAAARASGGFSGGGGGAAHASGGLSGGGGGGHAGGGGGGGGSHK